MSCGMDGVERMKDVITSYLRADFDVMNVRRMSKKDTRPLFDRLQSNGLHHVV